MWSCEWCDYPNENPLSYVCEVCGERSTFHTPPKPVKIEPEPEPEPEPMDENKAYDKPKPRFKVKPKLEVELTKRTIETALMVARLLVDDVPIGPATHDSNKKSEDKVVVDNWPSPVFIPRVQPPKAPPTLGVAAKTRAPSGPDHVCFMDPGSINCIICGKPMIFMTVAHLKYPDWLPTGIDGKIELINSLINPQNFYQLCVAINNGAIPEMTSHIEYDLQTPTVRGFYDEPEFPMSISFIYSDLENARYRGPTPSSLAAACRHALINNRPVVIPVNVIDVLGNELIQLLLITPPEKESVRIGKVRILNPKFYGSSPTMDSLMRSIVDDIKLQESAGIHWLFLTSEYWIQECGAAARILYSMSAPSESLMWLRAARLNGILPLTVASVLASGMTLPDVLSMFAGFLYVGQVANFMEVALDRIITFLIRDML